MRGTLPKARETQDPKKIRLELSRGVALRGFESHPPHHLTNLLLSLSLEDKSVPIGKLLFFLLLKVTPDNKTSNGPVRLMELFASNQYHQS
jgi:hypothetical protein